MPNPKPPAKGPSLVPVFAAVVVIVGAALAVAVLQNQEDEKASAQESPSPSTPAAGESGPNPFADIDNSPRSSASTRPTLVDTAPAGLESDVTYLKAKDLGQEGIALVREATAARDAGNEDAFRKKGAIAKAKLEKSLELTTDWLLELQDQYPNDRQVARIEREVTRWGKALGKVRMIR